MTDDGILRKHVLNVLGGGGAHVGFDEAVADFPAACAAQNRRMRPIRPGNCWSTCGWPSGTSSNSPATRGMFRRSFRRAIGLRPMRRPIETAWEKSIAAFQADLKAMERLVEDPKTDLLARIEHPDAKAEHTVLREALLMADHNAYHVGQLVLLRRMLGAWE